jgi:tRNA G46 methylase TrmB
MPIGNLARKLSTVTRDPGILWRRSKSSALDLLWKHWPAKSRDRMLSTWQAEFARSAVDRALFPYFFARWIDEIYLVEADPDERERLKSLCMGGISGVAWADKYEAAPIDFEVYPWFGAFNKALEEAAPESAAIQIGCSSGREVAHFARRHPRISFVGIDIDEAIILRASNVHPMPNLTFAVTPTAS